MINHTKVIAFYSFKGGCGRSLGLANVAYYLASIGKNVACIDMDVEAAGLVNIFDVTPKKKNIIDLLIRHDTDLDEIIVDYKEEKGGLAIEGNLLIIPAIVREDPARFLEIPDGEHASDMFKSETLTNLSAKCLLDYIFIDVRSGVSNSAFFINFKADAIVLFTRIDRQSQEGTKFLIDLLQEAELPAERIIVCNAIPDHPKANRLLSNLRDRVGKIDVHIPYNPAMVVEEKIVFLEDDQNTYDAVMNNYILLSKKITGDLIND